MNNLKQKFPFSLSLFLAFTAQLTFCHNYSETANKKVLAAIDEFQSTYKKIYDNNKKRGPLPLEAINRMEKAKKKMLYCVKQAVLAGANPNLIIYETTTLFFFMIGFCDLKLFNILIKSGADINTKDSNRLTPLMRLSSFINQDQIEIAKALIATPGININACNDNGETALIYAYHFGNHELVKALLEAGANINIALKYGRAARIM